MRAALNLIGTIIAYLAYLVGIRKEVTIDNLRNAFPDLPEAHIIRIARAAYRNIGIVFAEMLYLRYASRTSIARHVEVTNPEVFENSSRTNPGLVVVAGHFANWEWLALGGALVLKQSFAIVRKNIQTSFTEKFLERMRIRSGNQLINSADIRRMYRTLENQGCIALLADQSAPTESSHVLFFGRSVPTFEGPARLALRTHAAMLFAECVRTESGDYRITFQPIPYGDLIGDSPENVRELTYRHTRMLEETIRRHPEQWLWQHRRWKNA